MDSPSFQSFVVKNEEKSLRLMRRSANFGGRALALTSAAQSDSTTPVLLLQPNQATFLTQEEFSQQNDFFYLLDVYGCVGLIYLKDDVFVGFVTAIELETEFLGKRLYRVKAIQFFSLTTNKYDQVVNLIEYVDEATGNPAQHPCMDAIRFYSSGTFYFSWDMNITLHSQRRYTSDDPMINNTTSIHFWTQLDPRFFWNAYPLKDLLKLQVKLPQEMQGQSLLIALMQGFVESSSFKFGQVLLISRLSCQRVGTRFNTRGVDDDGYVANNVETEQVVYLQNENILLSYVQTRGSVPVFWHQQGLQVGAHKIELSTSPAAMFPAFRRHFQTQKVLYGPQRIVNLLSQKDAEFTLSETYRKQVATLKDPQVKMTSFDFHAQCKNGDYSKLPLLFSDIDRDLKSFASFIYNLSENKIISLQKGVLRTNCVDCLDRTNVIQSRVALAVLGMQLAAIGSPLKMSEFGRSVAGIWANNGDSLSILYTGTGALNSSVTRTGKRTIAGRLVDVKKNVNRFYNNNFLDNQRQEVYDILLGKMFRDQRYFCLLNDPVQEAVIQEVNARMDQFRTPKKIFVHIGTWNVNAKQPRESIESWLTFEDTPAPDIFVLGFQEIVELSAKQIMATDSSKRIGWEELINNTLNRNLRSRFGESYSWLGSEQLVGACICIFVKTSLLEHIRGVDEHIVKTGMSGMAGNKGGVAIRFNVYDTSFCFICAHMAAGQSNVDERNRDYQVIADGIRFQGGLTIFDHRNIFWFGDFNYRIALENVTVRNRVKNGDLESLKAFDQLNNSRRTGEAFQFFSEGSLQFPPTYKFDVGTSRYDTSEKFRVPAWTDRITWLGDRVDQIHYFHAELTSSDHKPVKAFFQVIVDSVDHKALESFTLDLYHSFILLKNIPPPQPEYSDPSEFLKSPNAKKILMSKKNSISLIDFSIELLRYFASVNGGGNGADIVMRKLDSSVAAPNSHSSLGNTSSRVVAPAQPPAETPLLIDLSEPASDSSPPPALPPRLPPRPKISNTVSTSLGNSNLNPNNNNNNNDSNELIDLLSSSSISANTATSVGKYSEYLIDLQDISYRQPINNNLSSSSMMSAAQPGTNDLDTYVPPSMPSGDPDFENFTESFDPYDFGD